MKPSAPPRRVLVICTRYLGDTLLLRPCLRALRAKFPEARIDTVVTQGTGCALDDCADVTRVIEWPRGTLAQAAALLGLGRYDWAVDFTGNDRSALISLASRAGFRVAYERPKLAAWSLRRAAYHVRPPHKKSKPHTLLQRLELLEACGVPSCGTAFGLTPRNSALATCRDLVQGLPDKILHAHVTSRDMQKALPSSIVRAVLVGAMEAGLGVVVTSGPAEVERAHVLACTCGLPSKHLRVFDSLDWHDLVAMISLSSAYWGCDTAPAHVAAALEKKMLIHYGPSRADHWSPLHAGGQADISQCACLKSRQVMCPRGEPGRCMDGILAGDVLVWLRTV